MFAAKDSYKFGVIVLFVILIYLKWLPEVDFFRFLKSQGYHGDAASGTASRGNITLSYEHKYDILQNIKYIMIFVGLERVI